MGNDPQQVPPRKRPWFVTLLLAILGLLLLDGGAQVVIRGHAAVRGSMLLIVGLVCIAIAGRAAAKRI